MKSTQAISAPRTTGTGMLTRSETFFENFTADEAKNWVLDNHPFDDAVHKLPTLDEVRLGLTDIGVIPTCMRRDDPHPIYSFQGRVGTTK